jgi:hypothetical protein
MSDKPIPPLPAGITQEQAEAIAGGSCTVSDVIGISDSLRQGYENLIDFTVYMAERVIGKK